MSPVIKATDRDRGIHGVAFNFDDMAARANTYLDKVRGEAAQIIAQARREADAIRRAAEVQGRQAGQQAVEETVRQQLGQQLGTLLPALQDVVREIEHAKQAWLTHWERGAVGLAAGIAARVIRRELTAAPEIALDLVREALELAAGGGRVRIHLNPADHKTLRPQLEQVVGALSPLAEAEILADAAISPGGCRVDTSFGVIDQQIETQLARIQAELT